LPSVGNSDRADVTDDSPENPRQEQPDFDQPVRQSLGPYSET
jgi:hypothetical protein